MGRPWRAAAPHGVSSHDRAARTHPSASGPDHGRSSAVVGARATPPRDTLIPTWRTGPHGYRRGKERGIPDRAPRPRSVPGAADPARGPACPEIGALSPAAVEDIAIAPVACRDHRAPFAADPRVASDDVASTRAEAAEIVGAAPSASVGMPL